MEDAKFVTYRCYVKDCPLFSKWRIQGANPAMPPVHFGYGLWPRPTKKQIIVV